MRVSYRLFYSPILEIAMRFRVALAAHGKLSRNVTRVPTLPPEAPARVIFPHCLNPQPPRHTARRSCQSGRNTRVLQTGLFKAKAAHRVAME